jgi:putative colanic acid biosynthesis UDP-glucose lipid carrier transferase
MTKRQTHRYSFLILPAIYLIDSVLVYFFVDKFNFTDIFSHLFAILFFWFFISYFTKYYEIYRNTAPSEIISKSIKQIAIFDLSVISFFHLFSIQTADKILLKYLLLLNILLIVAKLLIYIMLKIYRAKGGNIRKFIIVGYNDETVEFKELLAKRIDYGYVFDYFFDNKNTNDQIYGNFSDLEKYLLANEVDVIFCSLKECNDTQIKEIISLADDKFIKVKFIPDNKEILGKNLKIEHFDYFSVLSTQKSPLDKPVNQIVKRIFDIIFSILVIVFFLSWLIPLIGLLIKLESKGNIFFTQKRNGINYEPFYCYKFRSMRPNELADKKQVSKDDDRITKIGKVLRKTSIDELPQFFNVLKGEMSVVGPRPHMVKENERFLKQVDKFMGRHYVKPGVTGLAQVKGYRGEVKTTEDITNRVKYDLHYIENWSFWLDLKIIVFTVLDVIRGDEKAY